MTYQHCSLLIVGAGAAGLGAARRAKELGIDYLVLEASHRSGGRGLTEYLPAADRTESPSQNIPVDLGCHWLHCGSKNPLTVEAENIGWRFDRNSPKFTAFVNGAWQSSCFADQQLAHIAETYAEADRRFKCGQSAALWDCMDQNSEFASWTSYWIGLMHSNDPDCVDVSDYCCFDDTNEDWPVEDGYGALLERLGTELQINYNTPVVEVDWCTDKVRVTTPGDVYIAERVLLTVSTGILAAGDIRFEPKLPPAKLDAIQALPLGNYNNLFFRVDPDFFEDAPPAVSYIRNETAAYIYLMPFDKPYVYTCTVGRFAWWLEKQGQSASEQWFASVLGDIFGDAVHHHIDCFKASAWGFDPWVKGAYSSLRPGGGAHRAALASPLNDTLYFAGEATSPDQFNTAHGAWISGQQAVNKISFSTEF